ncbi:hypothetical protein [Halobacterium wangiae]|uniref:hypothetical protein n=1 Tax=Halobacterium wangiae TaxID=2902623 RepID=UPI001E31F815|nr:hypothetical protein [Halobacterium wangiae]
MSRQALQVLAVTALLALAGCTTGGQTATTTTTPSSTTTATPTTVQTTVPQADRVPFSLENEDDESHTVHLVVSNGSEAVYNDTVTIAPGTQRPVTNLTGQGTTYHVVATMDGAAFERNVTLKPGLLESGVAVNESGAFEYTYLVN